MLYSAPSWVSGWEAADCICKCRLLHTNTAYRLWRYCIWTIYQWPKVTHIYTRAWRETEKLCQPIGITLLHPADRWPMGITHQPLPPGLAWAGDASPPPPQKGQLREGTKDSRQMWTSRVVPETWQHWLFKPSTVDGKRLCSRSTGAVWPGGGGH